MGQSANLRVRPSLAAGAGGPANAGAAGKAKCLPEGALAIAQNLWSQGNLSPLDTLFGSSAIVNLIPTKGFGFIGHHLADGGIWKAPMVWFYSRSMVYLRLLGDSIARIKGSGGLGAPWKIVVTYSDPGNPDTTFSLQPSLEEARDVSLPALQADARAIARALEPVMGDCARALTS